MDNLKWLSTADLEALQNKDMSRVSDQGLQILAGGPPQPQPSAGDRAVMAAPSLVSEFGRQAGLTTRYAIEGVGDAVNLLSEPIRQNLTDPLVRLLFPRTLSSLVTNAKRESDSAGQLARDFSDWLGLPAPRGPYERVLGDVTRTGFGAMGMGGLASKGKSVADVADQALIQPGVAGLRARLSALPQAMTDALGTNVPLQVMSAAGAGGAGAVARENGVGPVGQTVAALAGGVASPLTAQGIGGVADRTGQFARGVYNFFTSQPASQNIEVRLTDLLGSRGIDWDSLNAGVKSYLKNTAGNYLLRGQPLDADALARLAHYQNVRGVVPTLGTVTQDPVILTQQANAAKIAANTGNRTLPELQNTNARNLLGALDDIGGGQLGVYDPRGAFDRTGGALVSQNGAMQARSDALYGTARDSIGRDVPLNRSDYLAAIYQNLAKQNRTAFLPDSVGRMLDQVAKGVDQFGNHVPFNPDTIDNLKTIISQEQRASSNGNVKAALGAVRDALDNTTPNLPPVGTGTSMVTPAQANALGQAQGIGQDALHAWDAARRAEAARHAWINDNPPVLDAVNGMEPAQWVKKYITNATPDGAASLNALLQSPASRDAVRAQLASYLKARLASGEPENGLAKTNPSALRQAVNDLQDVLPKWFDKNEVQRLRSIERVATYEKNQPTGSAVNNSNTAGSVLGTVANWLDSVASKFPMGKQVVSDPMRNIQVSLGTRRALNPVPGLLDMPLAGPSFQQLAAPMAIGGLLASPSINQP